MFESLTKSFFFTYKCLAYNRSVVRRSKLDFYCFYLKFNVTNVEVCVGR